LLRASWRALTRKEGNETRNADTHILVGIEEAFSSIYSAIYHSMWKKIGDDVLCMMQLLWKGIAMIPMDFRPTITSSQMGLLLCVTKSKNKYRNSFLGFYIPKMQ
jgi:hypothetical protein